MKIHNVRLGFATNSSSSHSIVIMPEGEHWGEREPYGDFEYGWEDFCLTTSQSKLEYLATALYQNLKTDLSSDEAAKTVKDMFGIDITSALDGDGWGAHIDHQSSITTPTPRRNKKFWKGFGEFIQDRRVAILGGNDNSDGNGYDDLPFVEMIRDGAGSNLKIKNDGDYWVMFNTTYGAKVRMSFDVDKHDAKDYVKSSTPELVDLKITDHCTMGCDFCYQGSTPEGKHAPFEDIKKTIDFLTGMKVFEIAIGGGEPTEHPQFAEILEYARKRNIVPNFTTNSVKWMKDADLVKRIKDSVGAIGVSVHKVSDFKKVETIKRTFGGWGGSHVMAQHVVGTLDVSDTSQLISEAFESRIPLLLLGYKKTGFGESFEPHDLTELPLILKLVLKEHRGSLSVDTAVLNQYPDITSVLEISKVLTTKEEGKFSCYIDAVEGTMGPSSYCDPTDMVPLDMKGFKKAYKGW